MDQQNNDIFKILISMSEDIGEIKSDVKNVMAQAVKTNGRVGILESIVNNWQGRIAVLSLFVGSGSALFITWLKGKLGL